MQARVPRNSRHPRILAIILATQPKIAYRATSRSFTNISRFQGSVIWLVVRYFCRVSRIPFIIGDRVTTHVGCLIVIAVADLRSHCNNVSGFMLAVIRRSMPSQACLGIIILMKQM
jgi:hypothetical protein